MPSSALTSPRKRVAKLKALISPPRGPRQAASHLPQQLQQLHGGHRPRRTSGSLLMLLQGWCEVLLRGFDDGLRAAWPQRPPRPPLRPLPLPPPQPFFSPPHSIQQETAPEPEWRPASARIWCRRSLHMQHRQPRPLRPRRLGPSHPLLRSGRHPPTSEALRCPARLQQGSPCCSQHSGPPRQRLRWRAAMQTRRETKTLGRVFGRSASPAGSCFEG
mmetsp:Transcript_66703/g.168257  ORF Transcript_66703/g.168257 Transcript_66703/m.168257 type:complete len:217 (+) Transcript_66703:1834-2484(+)